MLKTLFAPYNSSRPVSLAFFAPGGGDGGPCSPLVTARIIDRGDLRRADGQVVHYGVLMLVLAFLSWPAA